MPLCGCKGRHELLFACFRELVCALHMSISRKGRFKSWRRHTQVRHKAGALKRGNLVVWAHLLQAVWKEPNVKLTLQSAMKLSGFSFEVFAITSIPVGVTLFLQEYDLG